MAVDWTKLYDNYKGKWIALKSDEVTVIASGIKLSKVVEEAKSKGFDKPIVTKVPKNNLAYIG